MRFPRVMIVVLAAVWLSACTTPPTLVERLDASLASASKFLLTKQSADGAWRSGTYGIFRDGPSLTPFVMSSLAFMPQGGEESHRAYRRGVRYLDALIDEDGQIHSGPEGLNFPVYTASAASRVVALEEKTPANLRAQAAWLGLVSRYQLNESLGWQPGDPSYGGWGFAIRPPRKPEAGQMLERFFESNLSSTVCAIAALRSAKVPADDPRYRQALIFAQRCQNYSDDPATIDPKFDDGGFFFMPGDEVQNKAGLAGVDRIGMQRFHSYGTMTADGLRILIRCGLPPTHPRVIAARRWLERNFSPAHNPGHFNPDREVLRDATYYYYAWAIAHAFMALDVREIETDNGKIDWARSLATEILSRQRSDGSWKNDFTDAKEDDPVLATAWATSALAICRRVITGEDQRLR